jgi:O-antigen/teichoic acid export membrane protein
MARVLFSIGILQVLTILVALLRAKALSWQLGPAGFGVVSTLDQVVLALVQIGALGLPFTAMRHMSRSHSQSPDAFNATSANFVRAIGILGLVTTLVALGASAWQPALFGSDLVPYRRFLQLALVGIAATMVQSLLVNTLASAQKPAAAAGLNLAYMLVVAAAAVGGTAVDGLRGLYVAVAVAGVAMVLVSLLYLRRAIGLSLAGRASALVTELRASREILRSSASIYVTGAVYAVSLLGVRYAVFSHLGEAPAGLLQASLGIALTVGALLNPMSGLYLAPLLNRDMPPVAKVRAANAFAQGVLVLLLLGALPVVLFPRLLLGLLYTTAFVAAAATLATFVLWQCVYQTANIYHQLLIGLGDVVFMAASAVAGFGGAAVLAFALAPRFGLGGVGLALTIAMLGYGAAAVVRLRVRHHVPVPLHVIGRAAYVAAVIAGAGVLFRAEPELTMRGVLLRGAYALMVLGVAWWQLDSAHRARLLDVPLHLAQRARGWLPNRSIPG